MIELNLAANTTAEKLIKEYLENNVSDVLADKINNGVQITKDDKILINKKTLEGFMSYASGEAKKQAEKGARSACIEDSIVFGWAIHYFEEDSIEGTLYNEDGTEYKTAKKSTKAKTTPKVETKVTPIKTPPTPPIKTPKKTKEPDKAQLSFLDLM